MWANQNRWAHPRGDGLREEKHPITPLGYHRLVEKLRDLKLNLRHLMMNEISEARSLPGELSWNLQFQYLKQRQAFYESRIAELEEKLTTSEIVVGRRLMSKRVAFGVRVVIENVDTGEVSAYKMVGPFEADVKNGELSLASPLGRSLVGRYENEEVVVFAPAGRRIFRIVEIAI